MSALVLLRAKQQENIRHLHEQLMTGGILQKELWEEAEQYLIQQEIYDITQVEEADLRAYKKMLKDSGRFTQKQVKERSSALRKIHGYWLEKEYGELITEIQECVVTDEAYKGNVRDFLIQQGIHHIKDIDYTVRERYETELKKTREGLQVMRYLKVFDHIKQYSIKKEINSLPRMVKHQMRYSSQIIFLPYLPNQEIAKDFEYVRDKQELVWDFSQKAHEKLKKQVFLLLNYSTFPAEISKQCLNK